MSVENVVPINRLLDVSSVKSSALLLLDEAQESKVLKSKDRVCGNTSLSAKQVLFENQPEEKGEEEIKRRSVLRKMKSCSSKYDDVFGTRNDLRRQLSQANQMLEETNIARRRLDKLNIDFSKKYAKELLPNEANPPTNTVDFLREVIEELFEYVRQSHDRNEPVLEFHHPMELKGNLDLEVPEGPETLAQILNDCREALKYAVKSGHPRFFNQLSSGMDVVSLAGEWLTSTVNSNMFTYEVSPVFVLMERIVLKRMREIIGWADGEGDGIFAPGGTIANLYAVLAARHKYYPEIKSKGSLAQSQLCMFTSRHAHYSLKSAAHIVGIGTDNCITVETDGIGKMRPDDLKAKISKAKDEGKVPFLVSCTMGTTVVGAFDPITEIADICEEHNLWLHADAAWGGGALMSNKWKHLLDGINRADSVTWNPHKMMGASLQCSAILVKEDGILESCNAMHASYLFQRDKHYDISYDTGDKAIQCGRHVDIFKLWLMWRAKGRVGFEYHMNHMMDLKAHLIKLIKETEGFELVFENPEYVNVCFWYIPPCLRKNAKGPQRDFVVNKVAPFIKAQMMDKGDLMVSYQPLDQYPNFFRMVISNQAATMDDIQFVITRIEELGKTFRLD
uniref:Glutamate decarboxylase 1 n=1 Tax=Hofstenia miamia TaxID=442651 RepID=A0A7G7LK80_HOFMI|nr:glutamate decarboxylase 1 [Hofstenia miamia]